MAYDVSCAEGANEGAKDGEADGRNVGGSVWPATLGAAEGAGVGGGVGAAAPWVSVNEVAIFTFEDLCPSVQAIFTWTVPLEGKVHVDAALPLL